MAYYCKKNGYSYSLKLYNLASGLFPTNGGEMNCSYSYNSAGKSNYYHPVLTITFLLPVDTAATPAKGSTIKFSCTYYYKKYAGGTTATVVTISNVNATYAYSAAAPNAESGGFQWYKYSVTKDPGYSLDSWVITAAPANVSTDLISASGSVTDKPIYLAPLTSPTITFSTSSTGYVTISIKNSNSSTVTLYLEYLDIYDDKGNEDLYVNYNNLSGVTVSANSTLTYTIIGSADSDGPSELDASCIDTIGLVAWFKTSTNRSFYVEASY